MAHSYLPVVPVMMLMAGCVSYPVMEFRGTTVNLDGKGRVESGAHELGGQRSGALDHQKLFALRMNEGSEFRMLYPRDKALQTINPSQVRTYLASAQSDESLKDSTQSLNAIELRGSIKLKFRDDQHFTIDVDLKGTGTNDVALNGKFLAYHQREFEPMTYVAASAMLLGFGEGRPAEVKPKEGDLRLVRSYMAMLSKKPHAGASFDVYIVEASRRVSFRKTTARKNPIGILFSFPVHSNRDTALKLRMAMLCSEMSLPMNDAPSFNLNDPTTPTEPHFLSVNIYGDPAAVRDRLLLLLKQVFDVTEKTRFKVSE